MAFRRRFRRRRFSRSGRGVKRREPTWITTAFATNILPNTLSQVLFQLVGPEDYTPDYVDDPNRSERTLLVRTVGSFNMIGQLAAPTEGNSNVVLSWKAALFIASDKGVDDRLANDPTQFDITDPLVFIPFCRDFQPMHIFWSGYSRQVGFFGTEVEGWYPPAEIPRRDWDVTVKRRLEGDEALFLLININAAQSPVLATGAFIDVEARNLLME